MISKRGYPYLRRERGKHHLTAIGAVARKMTNYYLCCSSKQQALYVCHLDS